MPTNSVGMSPPAYSLVVECYWRGTGEYTSASLPVQFANGNLLLKQFAKAPGQVALPMSWFTE